MNATSAELLRILLESKALKFGDFVTKAGRNSPYFVNFGSVNQGEHLDALGAVFADAIQSMYPQPIEVVFGSAYKGIPLAAVTTAALARKYNRSVTYAANRKEAKDHGEGGSFLGFTPKSGTKVLIIDDVLSGGTSAHECIQIMQRVGADVVGMLVGLDRQERGKGSTSAHDEIKSTYNVEVKSICTLESMLKILAAGQVAGHAPLTKSQIEKVEAYVRNTFSL
jgi:orotate phosphoribosyltransferase